jgi:hypothetical protein
VIDDRLVVSADAGLEQRLRELARARMVFFAGLPGTGKSFLVHQLAHLAAASGRRVHRLQWDVARPVFEASPAGQRYPIVNGVTHAVIRKAAGLWARETVVAWNERHPGGEDLLIGEAPFVGGRFVELARPHDDDGEAWLASAACRFVLGVPTRDVRRHLEAERERRNAHPVHPREREDAPPRVMREAWRDLAAAGRRLGFDVGADYDPIPYRSIYATVLRHRHVDVLPLATILPTATLSVYDFAAEAPDVVPEPEATRAFIEAAERRHDGALLAREMDEWWRT